MVVFLVTGAWYYYQTSNRIIWSMIQLDGGAGHGNAHLLELPNGDIVLIDAGFEDVTRRDVIPYLEERGVDRIDQLIITDSPGYNYPGIASLLRRPGNVGHVYFNIPTAGDCARPEPPADCGGQETAQLRELVETSGASLRRFTTDDLLYYDEERDIILEVVYVHDDERETDPGKYGTATGTLLRLIYGNTTVLFTGDVNQSGGDRLVDEHYFLESAIMTAPRYRPAGRAVSGKFLGTVNARAIMVSDSAERWRDTGNESVRQFAFENDVPAYVTGLHGHVVVRLRRDGFTIDTERTASSD